MQGLRIGKHGLVRRFWFDPASLAAGVVRGYAASETGERNCALKVVARGSIHGLARSGGFSNQALADGVQHGWAGFSLGSLASALALSPGVEVRCAVSDNLLAAIGRDSVSVGAVARRSLDVAQVRQELRLALGCLDVRLALPMGERFRRLRGFEAFARASYLWLLRRPAGSDEIRDLAAGASGQDTIAVWSSFIESAEFREGPGLPVGGPYEPGFPFGPPVD